MLYEMFNDITKFAYIYVLDIFKIKKICFAACHVHLILKVLIYTLIVFCFSLSINNKKLYLISPFYKLY